MPRRRTVLESDGPKYRQVFERLSRDILAGKYKAGQKLPSEAALVRQFGTSRITVGRAVPNCLTSAASLGSFCPALYLPARISRESLSKTCRYFGPSDSRTVRRPGIC